MKWMLCCKQTISIMDRLHLSSVNRLSSMWFQVTALSWTALVAMSCHCYACAPHEFAAHKMCFWLVTCAYLFISKSRATRSIRRYRFIKGPGLRVFTEYRTLESLGEVVNSGWNDIFHVDGPQSAKLRVPYRMYQPNRRHN